MNLNLFAYIEERARRRALDQLRPFLATTDFFPWMNVPFTIGGHTYATYGRIIVRVVAIAGVAALADPDHRDKVLHIWRGFLPAKDWDFERFSNRSLPAPFFEQCESCNGTGRMDGSACFDCGGDHTREKGIPIILGNKKLNIFYLRKMCRLPKLEIAPRCTGREESMPFRFKGGRGLLMPMKWNQEEEMGNATSD